MQEATVAISLVNINFLPMLQEMLTSLLASDLRDYRCRLFYYDNGSTEACVDYVCSLPVPTHLVARESNQGIVGPRIELMQAILAQGWHYTLEVHTDMLFPRHWFRPLVEAMDARVAIVMPRMLQGPRPTLNELEQQAAQHRGTEVIINPAHVLPWLLNNAVVQRVGYYDPVYAPMRCEDDDFVYRVHAARYRSVATQRSVVFHEGGGIRHRMALLPWNENERIFESRYGLTPRQFAELLGRQPALELS